MKPPRKGMKRVELTADTLEHFQQRALTYCRANGLRGVYAHGSVPYTILGQDTKGYTAAQIVWKQATRDHGN
jgi:hypothetical protein